MKKDDKSKKRKKSRLTGDPIIDSPGATYQITPAKMPDYTPEELSNLKKLAEAYAKGHNFTMRISKIDMQILDFLAEVRSSIKHGRVGKSAVICELLHEEYRRCIERLRQQNEQSDFEKEK